MANALYSIGAVARMLGISVSTLRSWEERYGVVIASRSAGGQRRYSRDQLAQLQFVVDEVASGMLPGDAHRLLADRDAVSERDALGPADGSAGVLILVADRDPYSASIADYFLRTEGYRVEIVRSATDAVSRLDASAPSVVVVELLLSAGVGGPLFERLRQTDALVIVVSSLAASEIASELGAHAFLRKPIDPVELISTVRDLLGTSVLTGRASRAAPR